MNFRATFARVLAARAQKPHARKQTSIRAAVVLRPRAMSSHDVSCSCASCGEAAAAAHSLSAAGGGRSDAATAASPSAAGAPPPHAGAVGVSAAAQSGVGGAARAPCAHGSDDDGRCAAACSCRACLAYPSTATASGAAPPHVSCGGGLGARGAAACIGPSSLDVFLAELVLRCPLDPGLLRPNEAAYLRDFEVALGSVCQLCASCTCAGRDCGTALLRAHLPRILALVQAEVQRRASCRLKAQSRRDSLRGAADGAAAAAVPKRRHR